MTAPSRDAGDVGGRSGLDAGGRGGPSASRPVRVSGIDDHPIVLEGVVAMLLRQAPHVRWEGAASTPMELSALLDAASEPPDLVLVDLHLGSGVDALAVIADLEARGIAPIVFTSELRPMPIRRAVAAGARGVMLKSDPVESLVEVIEQVSAGDFAASSELAFVLLTDEQLAAHLTARELEVLTLLAEGVPRKAIGRRMQPEVGLATVITYINRICARYRSLGREVGSVNDVLREAALDGHLDFGQSGA